MLRLLLIICCSIVTHSDNMLEQLELFDMLMVFRPVVTDLVHHNHAFCTDMVYGLQKWINDRNLRLGYAVMDDKTIGPIILINNTIEDMCIRVYEEKRSRTGTISEISAETMKEMEKRQNDMQTIDGVPKLLTVVHIRHEENNASFEKHHLGLGVHFLADIAHSNKESNRVISYHASLASEYHEDKGNDELYGGFFANFILKQLIKCAGTIEKHVCHYNRENKCVRNVIINLDPKLPRALHRYCRHDYTEECDEKYCDNACTDSNGWTECKKSQIQMPARVNVEQIVFQGCVRYYTNGTGVYRCTKSGFFLDIDFWMDILCSPRWLVAIIAGITVVPIFLLSFSTAIMCSRNRAASRRLSSRDSTTSPLSVGSQSRGSSASQLPSTSVPSMQANYSNSGKPGDADKYGDGGRGGRNRRDPTRGRQRHIDDRDLRRRGAPMYTKGRGFWTVRRPPSITQTPANRIVEQMSPRGAAGYRKEGYIESFVGMQR